MDQAGHGHEGQESVRRDSFRSGSRERCRPPGSRFFFPFSERGHNSHRLLISENCRLQPLPAPLPPESGGEDECQKNRLRRDLLPIPDNIELQADWQPPPPVPDKPAPPKAAREERTRAIGVKGAVIVSQDGTNAKYKKKCSVCSHEDVSWHSLRITPGTVRAVFYCPKCSKKRDVEIQCSLR